MKPLYYAVALLMPLVATANSAAYRATIHPQATAYDGRTFDRQFGLTAQVSVAPSVTVQASAQTIQVCDVDDNAQPIDCHPACQVSLRAPIGQVSVENRDLETGRSERRTRTLTVAASAYAAAEGCSVNSVTLSDARDDDLLFSFDRVDFQLSGTSSKPLAVTRLTALGGGRYLLTSEPAAALDAFWSYRETAIWGVSGPVSMPLVP